MKPTTVIAGVLCLIGGVYLYGWSRERAGLERGRLEATAARVETLTVNVVRLDTVYRDKLRTFTKWDTLYQRSSDTIVVTRDTGRVVYINRAVADETVEMCRQALFSCDASLRARDTLIAGLRAQVALTEKTKPSRLNRILTNALWLGAGIGIGSVIR